MNGLPPASFREEVKGLRQSQIKLLGPRLKINRRTQILMQWLVPPSCQKTLWVQKLCDVSRRNYTRLWKRDPWKVTR